MRHAVRKEHVREEGVEAGDQGAPWFLEAVVGDGEDTHWGEEYRELEEGKSRGEAGVQRGEEGEVGGDVEVVPGAHVLRGKIYSNWEQKDTLLA